MGARPDECGRLATLRGWDELRRGHASTRLGVLRREPAGAVPAELAAHVRDDDMRRRPPLLRDVLRGLWRRARLLRAAAAGDAAATAAK